MTSPLDLMTSASLSTVHSHTLIVTSINKKYKKLRYNKMWWNKLFRLHSSVKETHRKRPVGPLLKKKRQTKHQTEKVCWRAVIPLHCALSFVGYNLSLTSRQDRPGQTSPSPQHNGVNAMSSSFLQNPSAGREGDRGAVLCECEEGIFQWKSRVDTVHSGRVFFFYYHLGGRSTGRLSRVCMSGGQWVCGGRRGG